MHVFLDAFHIYMHLAADVIRSDWMHAVVWLGVVSSVANKVFY